MKKFIKTIVSLTAASAMLLSTTAFAATTQTVTKYNAAGSTVTSTISGLTAGSMVTYLAHKDEAVSETGDNIVYIGQQTVDATESATFEYTISEDIPTGTYATVKYGSNVDDITTTNKIKVGEVTVVYDEDACTVTGAGKVGDGDTVTINISANSGYEIVAIKNGQVQIDPANASITAKAGDTITITSAAKSGTPVVYQLKGATLDPVATYTDTVYTNSAIVRVVGNISELYFTFAQNDSQYTMGGTSETEDGKFYVEGVSGSGYYGVEIEDVSTDVSSYTATAHGVYNETHVETIIIE